MINMKRFEDLYRSNHGADALSAGTRPCGLDNKRCSSTRPSIVMRGKRSVSIPVASQSQVRTIRVPGEMFLSVWRGTARVHARSIATSPSTDPRKYSRDTEPTEAYTRKRTMAVQRLQPGLLRPRRKNKISLEVVTVFKVADVGLANGEHR